MTSNFRDDMEDQLGEGIAQQPVTTAITKEVFKFSILLNKVL